MAKRKSMRDFIKENKQEIDKIIHQQGGMKDVSINNNDREEWIKNHPGLYGWAVSEGVNI